MLLDNIKQNVRFELRKCVFTSAWIYLKLHILRVELRTKNAE